MEILKFYTESCMPCRAVGKILDKLEGVKVTPVNAGEDAVMVDKYSVYSTPTLVFLKDDEEVARTQGLVSESKIKDIIKQYE